MHIILTLIACQAGLAGRLSPEAMEDTASVEDTGDTEAVEDTGDTASVDDTASVGDTGSTEPANACVGTGTGYDVGDVSEGWSLTNLDGVTVKLYDWCDQVVVIYPIIPSLVYSSDGKRVKDRIQALLNLRDAHPDELEVLLLVQEEDLSEEALVPSHTTLWDLGGSVANRYGEVSHGFNGHILAPGALIKEVNAELTVSLVEGYLR